MAQLFGLGTLKENTVDLSGFDQSKIDIIQDLYNDHKHGLLNDEVKYKEKFNQIFFGELLGYENRVHRIPEGHIKGVGNADIILGNFVDGKEEAENIQIACELKGAKSNLVKKQYGHGGLSPVGQGFGYKTGLKNCKWLIVSNFFEIRLYRDNQTDFEIWNLETLLDAKDNYFNLRSLYLLLHKDNLLSNIGTSKTENLLSHFRDEQLVITKKFYKEYKGLRIELLNDIKKNNPNLSVNTLVEKAQKIIDRLIFIFFCEDRGLLPDKKLKEGIERAGEFDISPREMTKRFFKGVDQGSEKLEIPDGYNGGLFKDDAILNSLKVGDEICKKFVELTNYDFHDDLSVNVLGHIFEQSISDLEDLKQELVGKESKVLQESKGRRKKDGIFYTPEYIVDYIVQNSVMKYLGDKEDECLKKHSKKKNGEILAYQEYQHVLQNIKVLDPACGSGAFLVRVFDVLFEENKRVGSILNSLFDDTEAYKNILTNNIYGVDLNEESVEITKLSLRLKSAQKGKKLNNLDSNIKCGNSLIDDPEIAGDKAFDWNMEFKEIMGEGGFDVIIGNPPYVVNKKDSILSKIYDRDTDLYLMFFEKSLKHLIKDQFYFGFITPRFFLVNKSTSEFRKYLLQDVNLIELVETSPFEDAETECVISIISSNKQKNKHIEIYEDISGEIRKTNLLKKFMFKDGDDIINTALSEKSLDILNKIDKDKTNLKKISISKRGMELGKPFLREQSVGIKTLIGQDMDRYSFSFENTFINESHKEYKRLKNFFSGEKIYLRRVAKNLLAYINSDFAYSKNIYGIEVNNTFSNRYILTLLNSKLLSFYYSNKFSTKKGDLFPEIQTYLYEQLPIKEILLSEQQPFIEKADKMLSLNKEFYEKIDIILKFLQQKYGLEKISKKLQKFYELDFKDFIKQLKIKNISMEEERELMQLFEKDKAEVLVLKEEIDSTDREIDEMVFELYGLSEGEGGVVLGR